MNKCPSESLRPPNYTTTPNVFVIIIISNPLSFTKTSKPIIMITIFNSSLPQIRSYTNPKTPLELVYVHVLTCVASFAGGDSTQRLNTPRSAISHLLKARPWVSVSVIALGIDVVAGEPGRSSGERGSVSSSSRVGGSGGGGAGGDSNPGSHGCGGRKALLREEHNGVRTV